MSHQRGLTVLWGQENEVGETLDHHGCHLSHIRVAVRHPLLHEFIDFAV
jgi:hypothetical protein